MFLGACACVCVFMWIHICTCIHHNKSSHSEIITKKTRQTNSERHCNLIYPVRILSYHSSLHLKLRSTLFHPHAITPRRKTKRKGGRRVEGRGSRMRSKPKSKHTTWWRVSTLHLRTALFVQLTEAFILLPSIFPLILVLTGIRHSRPNVSPSLRVFLFLSNT